MALVTEIENNLTGAAALAAAQLLVATDFTVNPAQGAGTLHPLAPTASVIGVMDAGDQDYFRVQLPAGAMVVLDVDGVTPPLDLTLFIYAPVGEPPLGPITGHSSTDPGSVTPADPFVGFTVSVGGLWSFGLQAVNAATSGSYAFRITLLNAPFALDGTAGQDLLSGALGDDTLRGFGGADHLTGEGGRDRLEGGAGDDTLVGDSTDPGAPGNPGEDTLFGQAGNDLLIGGGARDLLAGGVGNDTLEGGLAGDRLLGGEGHDELHDNTALFGPDGFSDILDGGGGNDTLWGGWADRLLGGAGDDRIILAFERANAILPPSFVDGGTGQDRLVLAARVFSTIELVAGPGGMGTIRAEGAAFGGEQAFAGTVRYLGIEALEITGGSGPDTLMAGEGNDTLAGGGGQRDVIAGGAGDDALYSFRAPFTFFGAATAAEDVLMQGGAGQDTLVLQGSGTGLLDGGDGNDVLIAREGGSAVLLGGEGADTISVSRGQHYAEGGEGEDVLDVAAGDGGPLVLEDLGDGMGFASAPGLMLDFAGFEHRRAIGGAEADLLTGGDGADTLLGGGGADTMIGGRGNDLYLVEEALDLLVEGGGRDTVMATISFALAGGFEDLVLLGTAALTGTGTGADNRITGNAGANTLYGLNGADTLDGGAGADRLFGGAGNDLFILRRGEAQGDRLMDFLGNGASAGDMIRFEGYGAGATLTNLGGTAAATSWRVQGANGSDGFTVVGAPGAFDPAFDAVFA